MKIPPPPIPPALDIEEAMKQRIPATTKGTEICNCDSWNPCVTFFNWEILSRIWLILSIVEKGCVCFAFEGLKAKKVMNNKNIILLVLILLLREF